MLISCKCLNFIATSNTTHYIQQQHHQLHSQSKIHGIGSHHLEASAGTTADTKSNTGNTHDDELGSSLTSSLINAFIKKYTRNFSFYSQCMDFFKQAIGPIPDLTINTINQSDLIYSLTLNTPGAIGNNTWQISICINCNTALYAKRITSNPPSPSSPTTPNAGTAFSGSSLINCILLTTNEELAQRKFDKSFSEAFGILIMDHQSWRHSGGIGNVTNGNCIASIGTQFSPAASTKSGANDVDNRQMSVMMMMTATATNSKQNRLKHLTQNLQARLKKEITDTDERIHRYTEQQFALLKSFREKSEQEYQILVNLVNEVPEQMPELTGAITIDAIGPTFNSRRKSTSSNRRNTQDSPAPATPTLKLATKSSTSAMDNTPQQQQQQHPQTGSVFLFNNRKIASFDTPPATPESTPMSIGNSPTFRQQQQQQSQESSPFGRQSFQQQFPTPIESGDDCFFELDGVDGLQMSVTAGDGNNDGRYRRNNSELDESDDAEEAEDALNFDTTMPIPYRQRDVTCRQHTRNFAQSLPIEIENSPLAQRTIVGDSDDDLLDDNVDIAASIKALAKSVHGEAVFGDLPRPRLRSQI